MGFSASIDIPNKVLMSETESTPASFSALVISVISVTLRDNLIISDVN